MGMGKSTAATFLSEFGAEVVDTDDLAREVVAPGQPALDEVRRAFGDDILLTGGTLDRAALARRVFADATERRKLEQILHPRIRAQWQAQLAAWRRAGVPLAVVVIPLLFETVVASSFDDTICVACEAATQFDRLRARGWTDVEIGQRVAAQMPVDRKMELCTFVVWTEGEIEVHREQLRRITRCAGMAPRDASGECVE